ncbi:macrodomain Ter protein MatP [Rodentibacter pneumotropicus]|uniref:Macrodomain Ter protein n=1 Tax=Rodentibacter pneumotropicus TaxID=758 RepID=A0A1V3K7E7_9PAST|nr:macrodomain Ter protein MatP [Rodentibacter pneumotropicus]MCQ9120896.1 macrodomain Ter protein MatP [Rodentibacter pneumotropicus]OOF64103.1 Ter macrodomain-binding protein MatP [Rodentibacter pneumotropicus]OOF69069.1 Ter macrodomain-binding protein MatP [Rodentibacter pneumotropicus]THA06660.1 macrodomain Ter protein MatP [Rodentibacter pneumotropicus]THA16291.1 macrodomain Ter protein MatP [Rodentibacter pneumotropicus]
MKYQKLENQEANWKWIYLIRKYREGENITRYEEKSLQESVVAELLESQNYPQKIENWIKQHLSTALPIKLDQAIRARRKRFFNAEKQSTKKKSIDLEYAVWLRLSKYSRKMNMTLSETITYMIDERESKALYESQMSAMKDSLKNLLK